VALELAILDQHATIGWQQFFHSSCVYRLVSAENSTWAVLLLLLLLNKKAWTYLI
jgi:hypothetical protein